jgi:hypothetical protein
MSDDTATIGFDEAARRLGVPLRVLRRSIRAGRIPAPPHHEATAPLPASWLSLVQEAVAAAPDSLRNTRPQPVPPFARYKGTSAWHKYRRRVRAYARFLGRA